MKMLKSSSTSPDLIVWASLAPNEDEFDSVGVYASPGDLTIFGQKLVDFIAGTSRQRPSPKTISHLLGTLSSDLAEKAHTGVVTWSNPGKGYGLIAPDVGGNDVFVHISAVQHAGLRKLNEGERVRFALQQREGRIAGIGIERLN